LVQDDEGIPKDSKRRASIAHKIVERAEAAGIAREDIIIDCLAFAIGADSNSGPAVMRPILEATLAWLDAQKKAGKLLEGYAIPGGRYVAICEHPSADDLAQTMASMPAGAFMNHEVYALADMRAEMKVIIENLKQAEQLVKK
jgi:muconolactone delta-isomerase